MSDDDSVRATSAFSVRDSLKTDDEDQSQPITATNAKLLRHEFNVMNNSNLVVCNLEKNVAQLLENNKQELMNKIEEEKQDKFKMKETETDKKITVDEEEFKPKSKGSTASQSLENPKSSKCDDVNAGLSKSVPPSYKQKLLQFSKDKLRFGSGGNRLTRSIKRSFHFSRSLDKNKTDTQRRISEPTIEILSIDDKIKYPKEEKDEDIEKKEVIEETLDDKDIANNDNVRRHEEKHEGNFKFLSSRHSSVN